MSSAYYCPWCEMTNHVALSRCLSCGLLLQGHLSPCKGDEQPGYQISRWLDHRYVIMRYLGKGGMGVVYEAVDGVLHRQVAIKKIKPVDVFPYQQEEAILLAQLDHFHLPHVYDYFSEGGYDYLVMELIRGVTLEAYLNGLPRKHVSIHHILALGIQLCSVLDYLHTRPNPIIFRDLKPTNIMLTKSGRLYLIDFGIARYFKSSSYQDTVRWGTSGYAAPEQYGWGQTTSRSDIYSLGVVLHQLITGEDPSKRPLQLTPLSPEKHSVPADLAQLIMSMINIEEEHRPTSAAIVKRTLQNIASTIEVFPTIYKYQFSPVALEC